MIHFQDKMIIYFLQNEALGRKNVNYLDIFNHSNDSFKMQNIILKKVNVIFLKYCCYYFNFQQNYKILQLRIKI